MGQAEYIVRFKGDYSALQKDINKIAGETKKLSDDEVIIKLAYDGNIKEFNKVFNQISEMHPELGIQFQYNVNQKILEQETDKLKKLTDIKIDVDENKAQKKLENLADYVETALMDGLSKDEINKRVRDVFGYYNTAIKAGAKNIDFGSIRNRLLDSFSIESDEIADIYAEIADRNINKPIELFKINTSINDEITRTTDRINDLQESLKYLEGKGASKTGLPTELEKVQDEIKILRADVDEMKQDLNSLTGEAFDKMTESIKETNVQLSEAIDKIKILSVAGVSDDKVSSLKTLMSLFSDFAKSNNGNNLSSFWDNLQVKINSGDDELKTLLSDLKLINAETGKLNIIEHGNVKSGGLLSDEYTLLATKRATQDTDFTVSSRLEDTIVLKQKLDEAADAGVNVSRILNIIYDEASDTFFELQETAKGDILGGMGEAEINTKVFEATDEQIQKLISDILYLNNIGVGIDFHGLNVLYDKIKGFSIIDTDIVPGYNFKDNWEDFTDDIIGGLNFSFEDSSGKMSEEAQGFVKRVQDVLANIDTSEIKGSAKKVVENAVNALQEAQNESLSAELTKPLGKDFGLGYAEGIREAMPEIVEACKEIVLAAYDAVKEASDAKNGEGNNFLDNFINNLKESLDNAVPTIQEKIKEVFSKIDIDNKSEESSLSSITSEDFKSQFQNAIDETGKYIIKVYGELIDDFKSRLQNSIDETGIYHVDIKGWLYDTFHDGLQRDIDEQEKYIIEVKGRLFDSFKEVLQEAIENLGPFPIEVKPYMRKGSEIEEVDLPGGNQNDFLSGTTIPSQQFNNEVQQNLVMLENYENTIKEIDKLKVDPETDEAKHKIQELNKLADYFASQITVIRSENGHEVNRSMMYFNGVPNNHLMENYSMDDIKRFTRVADERSGLNRDNVPNGFFGIEEELSRIEHASEGLRNALTKNLSDSKAYVSRVRADLLNLVEIYEELEHVKEGSRDYELYQKDIKVFSERTPEVLQFLDKIKTYDQAHEFVKTDEWLDFLATLPQAHTYLESIGYDFDKINRASNETPVSTESTNAETKALLSKKEVVEQLRAELNLTKKVAEDLFDQQGYAKTNNKYQIEQTAVDELIASLKEKKQVEESQDSFTTSPTANAMQSEVEAVNQGIDAEKKKFDELKNKISKTIPTAINKKNQAFEKERDLVAKVVDDEVDYFDVLKDSINSVTNTIEKQYDTTKNAKPKADKSNNKSSNNKSSSNKSNKPDKDVLLQQHYVDLRKDAYQSFGQKSDIQKEMSKYYSQLEKESSDIYSSANKKANGLLDKIKKLNFDKYTEDFIDELKSAESELTDFLNQLKAGVVPLDEIDNRISVLATNIEDTLSKKALGNVKKVGEKTLSNIALKIDQIIAKNSAMGKQYEDRFKGLRKELEEAKNVDVAKRIIADVNQLESEIINAGKTGVSFIDQIKQRLRDMNSKYIAQYFSFQDIIRYARQAVTNVVQLNDAFIELSKVSNTSLEDLESDFQSYANTAKDIGGTITDTISATADWSRLGYNVPDSKELAEVAMLYKNVGDGIDINTANESLISTLRGFKMEADDAISVVDKFNEVSNNFAISSGGIGESLQRSAAAFSAANTDLSQSIALITATNEIVQDPDAVGSMWTTVSARIRGAKSELEDMGEDTEDMVESTSKLRDLVKGITGVDIMLDENTFKDIYTIITQIGDKWNEISDIDQAALLEALAGKRQANRLAAVLGNLDHLKEAYQTAEESAGSARREQENFEKGITYSINQAKATLEELSYDAINSDFLKGLVNTGTKLLEIIDKIIDKFGLFKSLIIGGATVLGSQKLG